MLEPEPKKITVLVPAPAPAIIQKKHLHDQIFSEYDNEFRFLLSYCSVHARLLFIFFFLKEKYGYEFLVNCLLKLTRSQEPGAGVAEKKTAPQLCFFLPFSGLNYLISVQYLPLRFVPSAGQLISGNHHPPTLEICIFRIRHVY